MVMNGKEKVQRNLQFLITKYVEGTKLILGDMFKVKEVFFLYDK